MDEVNLNSSLAGVKLAVRDNETGRLVFWTSLPCEEDKEYIKEETKTRLKLGKKKKKK